MSVGKYVRFEARGAAAYGRLEGERVEVLSSAPWAGGRPTGAGPGPGGGKWGGARPPAEKPPLREPAGALGNDPPRDPLLFLKPPSAVIGPEAPIVYPPASRRVDYEGELALVIGKRCGRLKPEENPLDYLFGFTCLNDIT